jgi:hypothetical protein
MLSVMKNFKITIKLLKAYKTYVFAANEKSSDILESEDFK